jgi:hypothetical protein
MRLCPDPDLIWTRDLAFAGSRGGWSVTLDSAGVAGSSPALAPSRGQYCSVRHSMREDIAFTATWGREASA